MPTNRIQKENPLQGYLHHESGSRSGRVVVGYTVSRSRARVFVRPDILRGGVVFLCAALLSIDLMSIDLMSIDLRKLPSAGFELGQSLLTP